MVRPNHAAELLFARCVLPSTKAMKHGDTRKNILQVKLLEPEHVNEVLTQHVINHNANARRSKTPRKESCQQPLANNTNVESARAVNLSIPTYVLGPSG